MPPKERAVDSILGTARSRWYGGGRDDVGEGQTSQAGHHTAGLRHLLLPVLHAIHARIGWISPGALNYACLRLNVPPAEAFGVAGFYDMFSLSEQPSTVIRVCDDIACQSCGADALCSTLERSLGSAGDGAGGSEVKWVRSPCLGLCERAPAVLVTTAGGQAWDRVLAPAAGDEVVNSVRNGRPAACDSHPV